MFNKILLSSDGSEHALRAAEKAIALAVSNPDAVIEVVYVIDGSKSKTDVLHSSNEIDLEKKRKEKKNWL